MVARVVARHSESLDLVMAVRHACDCPLPANLDDPDVDWRLFCCRHFAWIVADDTVIQHLRYGRHLAPRLLREEWRM